VDAGLIRQQRDMPARIGLGRLVPTNGLGASQQNATYSITFGRYALLLRYRRTVRSS
jgi:hypothetical protein